MIVRSEEDFVMRGSAVFLRESAKLTLLNSLEKENIIALLKKIPKK